jgi:hypothetical protein
VLKVLEMASNPSLKSFCINTFYRLELVQYGEEKLDKLNMLSYEFLSSVPRSIRRRLPYLNKKIEELGNILMKKTLFNLNGIKFTVTDPDATVVLSRLYEKWMWNYLKVKSDDVFWTLVLTLEDMHWR